MRSWSVSSIRSFHGCQLAWYFRRTNVEPAFKPLALVEGTVLHAVLAFHLQGMKDGKTPEADEALSLLDALYFLEEASGDIRYGKKDREQVIERLRTLFLFWREHHQPTHEIVSVEEKLRVELPGLDLPLLGYLDVVLKTPSGIQVVDFKVTTSKPWPDSLLDQFDLQKLAYSRGFETAHASPIVSFGWTHLVKTKSPQVTHRTLPVTAHQRNQELGRIASIVNPTLQSMQAVLEQRLTPCPTTAHLRLCRSCGYREPCARYAASRGSAPPSSPSGSNRIGGRAGARSSR